MKEQYILMRKKKWFDYQLMYNYYINKGGIDIDFNLFAIIIDTARRLDILSGLDAEFGLISLHDNQGNEIMVIN